MIFWTLHFEHHKVLSRFHFNIPFHVKYNLISSSIFQTCFNTYGKVFVFSLLPATLSSSDNRSAHLHLVPVDDKEANIQVTAPISDFSSFINTKLNIPPNHVAAIYLPETLEVTENNIGTN